MRSLIIALFLLTALYHNAAKARVIYVDATAAGSGSGTSWANAYTRLSDALMASNASATTDSICIAAGIYYPTGIQTSIVRDSSFCITRGGVQIYGGYPAGGGVRNPALQKVFLDGNIGAPGSATDNSYHVLVLAGVVSGADSVIVSGITVRNGYATGGGNFQYLAGRRIVRRFGGGVYITKCDAGNLLFMDCTVSGNQSTGNSGVGGVLGGAGSPASSGSGGGIRVDSSTVAFRNCVVSSNRAKGGSSGGMNNQSGEAFGGGCALSVSTASFVNCLFTDNQASGTYYSNNTTFGATITMHKAGYGGAISQENTTAAITSCTFARNTNQVGFMSGQVGLIGAGATYFNGGSNTLSIKNSVFWSNRSFSNTVSTSDSSPGIFGGTVQYSVAAGITGTGNIAADPSFVDASTNNFRLQSSSIAINAGNNLDIPVGISTDIEGAPRISQSVVDMGAYEAPASGLTGNTALCLGAGTMFAGYPAGGSYASSDTAVLKVNPSTGAAIAAATGSATVSYLAGATSLQLAVTVSAGAPIAAITGGTSTLCAGTSITLSNATPGGIWSSVDNTVATVNSNTGVVTGTGAGGTGAIVYTVYPAGGNGCPSADSYAVTVLLPPSLGANLITPYLCTGTSGQLTAYAGNGTLSWSSNNTAVATVNQTGIVTGVAPGNAGIKATNTGANGCATSINYTVSVNARPAIAPITGPDSVCQKAQITLSNVKTGGTWSVPSYTIITANNLGVITGMSPGTDSIFYTIASPYSAACSSRVGHRIDVLPTPVPVIVQTGGDLSTSAVGSYLWSLNGTPVPGATNQTITPAGAGSYTVTVTSTWGCSGTSDPFVVGSLSVAAAASKATGIRVYPNPTTGIVHLDTQVSGNLVLATPDGRIVLQQESDRELSVANLPAGTYILTLRDKSGKVLLREKLIRLAD